MWPRDSLIIEQKSFYTDAFPYGLFSTQYNDLKYSRTNRTIYQSAPIVNAVALAFRR